jgi:hypothetical protein
MINVHQQQQTIRPSAAAAVAAADLQQEGNKNYNIQQCKH